MKKIYFDYAAATPVDKAVIKAMQPYFTELFYNPSALYLASKQVSKAMNEARAGVAKWLGARPSEIVFTAGGTEANNLAIQGVMSKYPGSDLLVSAIEHESIIQPAHQYDNRKIAVDSQGMVSLTDLESKISDRTVLISVMYANNEIGTIQPLKQIASMVDTVRNQRKQAGNTLPLYFHTDACQAANYLSLYAKQLGVDMMTLNGGKMYGPKQSGVLYVGSHTNISPILLGGGQERGYRSGTENVPSIVGFAAALSLAQSRRQEEGKRISSLQQLFLTLLSDKLPQAIVNGSLKSRLVNNLNITLPGYDNERVVMTLDELGVQCASGSACSAQKGEPSHVLQAMGIDEKYARSSIRFSMGTLTKESDVRKTVELLVKIVA